MSGFALVHRMTSDNNQPKILNGVKRYTSMYVWREQTLPHPSPSTQFCCCIVYIDCPLVITLFLPFVQQLASMFGYMTSSCLRLSLFCCGQNFITKVFMHFSICKGKWGLVSSSFLMIDLKTFDRYGIYLNHLHAIWWCFDFPLPLCLQCTAHNGLFLWHIDKFILEQPVASQECSSGSDGGCTQEVVTSSRQSKGKGNFAWH
jgi:hypothetical protein